MTLRLKEKFALITGGTAGIGLETARQFQLEGAKVIVTGRSDAGLIEAKTLLGDAALYFKNDASDVAQQRALANILKSLVPRLDVLFVNAGDVTHKSIEDWDSESFDRVINTNLKGPFFLIQSLLPLMAKQSSIILCGSVSARIGLPQSSVYSASKAGLISLSRTLSGELKHRGIRINTLSPGPTYTTAFDKFGLPEHEQKALVEEVKQLVPLNRLGSPIELAKAAVFMASNESTYMLGAELLIDGGVGNL
ncbi:SDR family oxidoreductase [Vibrio fluvialis]|uniref:SDR family oxidoreductase n=1 Tax=Vibrio fluvialis TaxID=676 RepID=UPI0013023339|nr:SDR family oxidoreductase [Vibrio fluvialis]EKO3415894.1 SDR family oxidoreductase [Vibrio fluvialis]EKO3512259.1 SDR family oxidoreductase [Vibrio fluvialis]ELF6479976.1 SDR family oxidoreductase [Vibrio fluvialis]ELG4655188.1 SDR family oxidoreductase [Vibrio fluvialis]ELV8645893.1 SDR family oxidoreductase [Vibrio fluvialis]